MKQKFIPFKILRKKEKAEIEEKLKNQFGIKKLPGILLRRGRERIFLYQGSFSAKQIKELEFNVPTERIGIYFAKLVKDKIRLSIEGVHLLKDQINKNIFELDEEQAEQWMQGQELLIQTGKRDFLIMKFGEDFLGCGKASDEKIGNYIPKSRRLKNRNIVV
ncbi:hypothetical protein ACFLZJ_01995 [Nanoarchaeota archaeon]